MEAKDGSALEKHIIRTIASNSEHSCRVQCYLENACLSYNFGKRVTGDEVCELNNSTDIQHPDDLKPRENFIYRGAEVYKVSYNFTIFVSRKGSLYIGITVSRKAAKKFSLKNRRKY